MITFFKKVVVVIFMITFLGLIGWLIWQGSKPEVFPVGSMMPELGYRNPEGNYVLNADTTKITMIVLFHRKCEHCLYQLEQFNDHFDELVGTNIFIFTAEQQLFENSDLDQWPRLSDSQNVHWGIVDRKEFKNNFGGTATPYILFFDESGKLYYKIRGEVKMERILESLMNPKQT